LQADAVVRARLRLSGKLVALTARHAVPAVYNRRASAASGGLLSYGPSIPAADVTKGVYEGKILKGAKPSDLPVQQATTLKLVVDLKTEGARPRGAATAAGARRRGDRVTT
jgi:putative ABC transport system substrate-binding protein